MDVSFCVESGEVFGFLGPNGAGKTTTIRHIMGFSKPQNGMTAVGGIAFMASCIFNLSRNSLAVVAGIPVFFYIMSIVGQMGRTTRANGYGRREFKSF